MIDTAISRNNKNRQRAVINIEINSRNNEYERRYAEYTRSSNNISSNVSRKERGRIARESQISTVYKNSLYVIPLYAFPEIAGRDSRSEINLPRLGSESTSNKPILISSGAVRSTVLDSSKKIGLGSGKELPLRTPRRVPPSVPAASPFIFRSATESHAATDNFVCYVFSRRCGIRDSAARELFVGTKGTEPSPGQTEIKRERNETKRRKNTAEILAFDQRGSAAFRGAR